jgi:hypothetical protein
MLLKFFFFADAMLCWYGFDFSQLVCLFVCLFAFLMLIGTVWFSHKDAVTLQERLFNGGDNF